jgi:polyferredoxin
VEEAKNTRALVRLRKSVSWYPFLLGKGVSMKKGLIIGTIVLWVVWVIAAAILVPMLILGTLIVGILIWAWISFVRKVWEKGTSLFHEEMKPKLAEKRLKRLKTFLLVAGISLAASIAGFAIYLVLFEQYEIDDSISFGFGLFGMMAFIIAIISSLILFIRGRRKHHKGVLK